MLTFFAKYANFGDKKGYFLNLFKENRIRKRIENYEA